MKVKELIAKLQEFGGDLEIMMFDYCAGSPNEIDEEIEVCNDDDFGTFVGLFSK